MRGLGRRTLVFVVLLLVVHLCIGASTVLAGYHIVKAGETLSSIGRLYGVNAYAISAANDLSNPNYIYIGQVLYIPVDGGAQPAPPQQYYYPPNYSYWWNHWYAQNYWWYHSYWDHVPTTHGYDGCPYGCTAPQVSCYIKGNISMPAGEKIYHLPGQKYYNDTIIRPEYGERWFCTEQEAIANGWRKSEV